MIELPRPGRIQCDPASRKRIYVYGTSFSGKSYFANAFPNVFIISTDGNQVTTDREIVDGKQVAKVWPSILVADKDMGMIGTKKVIKSGWEVFKEITEQLKNNPGYETVVVDLVDDISEFCRKFVLDKNGWEHEDDGGYGRGWKAVSTEFDKWIFALNSLPIPNIIYISHDATVTINPKREATITTIKPNIQYKMACAISSKMDFTGRIVGEDGVYRLVIKGSETVFGGGRADFANTEIILPETPNGCTGETPIYKIIQKMYRGEQVDEIRPIVEEPKPTAIIKKKTPIANTAEVPVKATEDPVISVADTEPNAVSIGNAVVEPTPSEVDPASIAIEPEKSKKQPYIRTPKKQ